MKRVLNSRPVAFLAFFLVLGIAAAYYLGLPEIFSLPAWILCGLIFVILFITGNKRMLIALYLLIFFLGAFLFQIQFHTDFPEFEVQETCRITGYVSDRSKMDSETHVYLLTNVMIGERDFNNDWRAGF